MDEEKDEPKKKKPKQVKVRVIRRRGESALVEWLDGDQQNRVMIPVTAVVDGLVADDVLSAGVPYGVPWAELVQLTATAEKIQAELYRVGVWTVDDLRRNPQLALGAVQRIYGVDLSALMRAAKEYESGGKQ